MLEITESTRFQDFPDTRRDLTSRVIDYHPGLTRRGANYGFYDPLTLRKIGDQNEWSRSTGTRAVKHDIRHGWVSDDEDVERTPPDESHDYNGYFQGFGAEVQTGNVPSYQPGAVPVAANDHASGADLKNGGNQPTGCGDDASTIRILLGEVGVIFFNEPMMNLSEMRAYVRGSLGR